MYEKVLFREKEKHIATLQYSTKDLELSVETRKPTATEGHYEAGWLASLEVCQMPQARVISWAINYILPVAIHDPIAGEIFLTHQPSLFLEVKTTNEK